MSPPPRAVPCARRRRRPRLPCRVGWGATLPCSVTVGDRLAQKSDRHRPLSLRPVSLVLRCRRIYMQFLLIVYIHIIIIVVCRGAALAVVGTSLLPPPQLHRTTADTFVIPRTVTTGRVQWLPKNWKTRIFFFSFPTFFLHIMSTAERPFIRCNPRKAKYVHQNL